MSLISGLTTRVRRVAARVGHRVVVNELPTKVTHRRTHHTMTQDHSGLLHDRVTVSVSCR